MTDDKDTIIDAKFTETTDTSTSEETSLVVPKRPGKPASPETQKDAGSQTYGRTIAYAVLILIGLAVVGLYLRGMVLAA
jgi:uncharacterized protein HemX